MVSMKMEYLTNSREFHSKSPKMQNLMENEFVLVLRERIIKRDLPIIAINQVLLG